jgi:hypothetical protein
MKFLNFFGSHRRPIVTPTDLKKLFSNQMVLSVWQGVNVGRRFTASSAVRQTPSRRLRSAPSKERAKRIDRCLFSAADKITRDNAFSNQQSDRVGKACPPAAPAALIRNQIAVSLQDRDARTGRHAWFPLRCLNDGLSHRRKHKGAFPFRRILCTRGFEIPKTAFLSRGI